MLEEDLFLVGFHQWVPKVRENAWHDHHIKKPTFKNGDFILMYDSKFINFLERFQMHCLGPYVIKDIS